MGTQDHFTFEVDEGVGIITLNRPERMNAVNWDLCKAIADHLRMLRTDDDIRVIVLTGAGGNFSSGGDAEFLSGNDASRPIPGLTDTPLERYQRKTPAGAFAELTKWIVEVDKPVIAAVEGVCMGAGLAYALACDRRFGSKTVRMSAAMVRLGFGPDCGITYFLPRVARLPTALRMITTGDILKADECFQEGLIDELVEEGEALSAALVYAKKLASGPSVAVDLARHFIHKSLTSTLDEMLDYEGVAAVMSAMTEDAREGTNAFLEKRKPTYKGR
jgi:2-(1,2-epoxy-1,2-dihydrophenyl)acetyl-CoA isomerase